MAGRRTQVFILFFLFLLPGFLFGQSPEDTERFFYIERIGGEDRFIQRLSWEKTDYVYRYEITVEEQSGSGEYAEILREFRTENFIELSLSPGSYRYRIGVYNLLNRPAGISPWIPFRVFPALQPELYSFSQNFLPAETGDPQVEITLRGANLVDGAEPRIQSESGGGDIAPRAFFPEGESVRLVFNRLAPGPYRVWIRNPGGLEASLSVTVAPPPAPAADTAVADEADTAADEAAADALVGESDTGPAADEAVPDRAAGAAPDIRGIYVSAEYAPMIPLYGYVFSPFDSVFYPAGVSLRVGFTPLMRSWGDLGLELTPSLNRLDSDAVKIHMGTVRLNGLYQRFFTDAVALVLRAGAGASFIYGTEDQVSASIFTWIFSAGGGIFLRCFIPGTVLYLEGGAEFNHLFAKDDPAGYIKPALGLGARF
ncbi:MAG: hypothetical protein LBG22_02335 [Treponema sp.]|jgi:hypothetical protein|nr:hypothetical protein [Treponema sp.]